MATTQVQQALSLIPFLGMLHFPQFMTQDTLKHRILFFASMSTDQPEYTQRLWRSFECLEKCFHR